MFPKEEIKLRVSFKGYWSAFASLNFNRMTGIKIKIKVGGTYQFARLIISGSEITFIYKAYNVTAKHEYPFMSLKHIREVMEKENILLIVNGSRKDVYPSGMSLVGDKAYVLTIGKPGLLKDLVNIFDEPNEIGLIGTVEEQLKYHNEWVKSILNR